MPHHIPGLIHAFRFFISGSGAKTLACIIRVRAHIVHPNPKTCLFCDTMSVVVGVARCDSFLVFDQCCHHKSVPLDRGCTQSIRLLRFEDLPFDKTHLLVHSLGSKVTKSYTHRRVFLPLSIPFHVFSALKATHQQRTKSENVNVILLWCKRNRDTFCF